MILRSFLFPFDSNKSFLSVELFGVRVISRAYCIVFEIENFSFFKKKESHKVVVRERILLLYAETFLSNHIFTAPSFLFPVRKKQRRKQQKMHSPKVSSSSFRKLGRNLVVCFFFLRIWWKTWRDWLNRWLVYTSFYKQHQIFEFTPKVV